MNKNKKRLSKLLIPMLAVSGINVNAMENVKKNVHRNKSFNNVKINIRKKMNSEPSKKGVLIKNIKFKKNLQQYVIQYGGKALDDFNDKYEILPTKQYRNVINTLNLDGLVFGEAAGHGGSVSQCRDKTTGEIFAVKYIPDFTTTGIKTLNSKNSHSEDLTNEKAFYEDYKKHWHRMPWALKYYDFFIDENGGYAVTEWIDKKNATTLNEYLQSLQSLKPLKPTADIPEFAERVGKFARIAEQFNQIVDDLEAKEKENRDLHGQNLMVIFDQHDPTQTPILKLVDNGWYRDKKAKFEEQCTTLLLDYFKKIAFPEELKNLSDYSKKNDKVKKIYDKLEDALAMLNAEILINFDIYGCKREKFIYEARNRQSFVYYLDKVKKYGELLAQNK